ncbi:MAG: hypothetical protein ACRC41_07665 [Sarcina sp.]
MSKNYYGNSSYGCSCGGNNNNNNYDDDLKQYVVGNSVDFEIDDCDAEIKADITVGTRESVRVWGQIRDCDGNPVPYAYLKLIKETTQGMFGVAHTITDCYGYYQFDICRCTDGSRFTILVGKAARGREKVVSTGINGSNCPDICNILDGNCNC